MPAKKSTTRKRPVKQPKAAATRSRSKPTSSRTLVQDIAMAPSPREMPVYEMREARAVEVRESDAELFDTARSQWLTGDWDALVGWHVAEFANHPKRARIALLVASALHEVGDYDGAKEALRQAIEWGAQRRDVINVVVGQAHAALGRARVAGKEFDKAKRHFVACITSIAPNRSAARYAKDRLFKEAVALGFLPDARRLLESELSDLKDSPTAMGPRLEEFAEKLAALETMALPAPQPAANSATQASEIDPAQIQSSALAFYSALPSKENGARIPFLLIDSKSLPRSGLHFMKHALSKLFGESFSFCEWYHEYGCCRSMPCALTGFASQAERSNSLRIRLIKSHDFDLQDPVYATNHYVRRLILLRHPLYILTSWFALDQLNNYGKELARQGIQLQKIWLQHEREVVREAYQCLDLHFRPPSAPELAEWLQGKENYVRGFVSKWANPVSPPMNDFTTVVRYENLMQYLHGLVSEYSGFLPADLQDGVHAHMTRIEAEFKPRQDAMSLPSQKLTQYLQENSAAFSAAASRLSSPSLLQSSLGET